jgi:Protein of unknown function (DUF2934)
MNEANESGISPPVIPSSGGVTSDPSHEQLADFAYFIWLSEGCPEGQDKSNWHEAEEQLRFAVPG